LTGIILAGGKNSRISMTKAFIQLGEQTIIERTVDIFKALFTEVIIVTNQPDDYAHLGTKLVRDAIPNSGPLGGLYSGLSVSSNRYNLVVACDMPFIDPALIRHLQPYARDEYFDVILPEYNGFTEPLCAIYSKSCINTIEVFLNQNILKIRSFFTHVRVKEVKCDKFSAIEKSFFNINTREDLLLARSIICG